MLAVIAAISLLRKQINRFLVKKKGLASPLLKGYGRA